MLPLPNLEEIQQHMLELPDIVQAYEERRGDFAEQARAWMVRLEAALKNNQLPAAGTVATLRAMVISAERGALPPGLTFVGSPSARKVHDAAASEALRRAEETVNNVLRADVSQIDEARRLMRQMIAVAHRRGLLATVAQAASVSDAVNALWGAFLQDAELAPAATRVSGLAGPFNALVLLSREMHHP